METAPPRRMLDELLEPGALRIDFQPIVTVADNDVRLYALEALTRGPRGTTMERPDVLFEYARRKGEETRIDLICIAQALCAAAPLPGRPHISLNVHGSTLGNVPRFTQRLFDMASAFDIAPDRLIVEIVEYRSPWQTDGLRSTLRELREGGVRIALDDLGGGASNFHMFIDCRPDHIKIDRYIVNGCSRDPWRVAVLHSIVALAGACGATPIAEGVEEYEDLVTVRALGIDRIQGWLYSRSLSPHELTASRFLNHD
jgi:EAL domain-containing protein (putative c-di-GMP-specific phosphodiesterase class I)